MAGGGASAMGVMLEPGERVVYAFKADYSRDKRLFWVLGVVTLIVVVGLIFIVMALLVDRINPRALLVTNRRFVLISGKGEATSVALGDIVDIKPIRQSRSGAAGAFGALGALIANAITNYRANKHDRLSVEYWASTVSIVVHRRSGSPLRARTSDGATLGPLLLRCTTTPGFAEQLPSVATPP